MGGAIKELRGYDHKNAPKPVPYDFGMSMNSMLGGTS